MRYVKRIMVLFAMLFFIPMAALAGDISGGVSPTTAGGGAMNTLEDIYNLINLGTTNVPRTTIFAEPTAGPVATGHTLTQVYDRAKTSSRPARTGQTSMIPLDVTGIAGADGKLQKGVTWPSSSSVPSSARFTSNSAGTVIDNLTGLMWAKNATAAGPKTWTEALSYCNLLTIDGTYSGWRLPNRFELESLLDLAYGGSSPKVALSNDAGTGMWVNGDVGSSFTGVQPVYYWSSTTYAGNTGYAWLVSLDDGNVTSGDKANANYVWPVHGGQS
jgi:hypothetical protein